MQLISYSLDIINRCFKSIWGCWEIVLQTILLLSFLPLTCMQTFLKVDCINKQRILISFIVCMHKDGWIWKCKAPDVLSCFPAPGLSAPASASFWPSWDRLWVEEEWMVCLPVVGGGWISVAFFTSQRLAAGYKSRLELALWASCL